MFIEFQRFSENLLARTAAEPVPPHDHANRPSLHPTVERALEEARRRLQDAGEFDKSIGREVFS